MCLAILNIVSNIILIIIEHQLLRIWNCRAEKCPLKMAYSLVLRTEGECFGKKGIGWTPYYSGSVRRYLVITVTLNSFQVALSHVLHSRKKSAECNV